MELRLSDAEYAKLLQVANSTGYSVSAVLRCMIEGYQLKPRPTEELLEFNRQMLQIGTNLNQIAARANSLGFIDVPYYRQQAEEWNELRLKLYERFLMPEKAQ